MKKYFVFVLLSLVALSYSQTVSLTPLPFEKGFEDGFNSYKKENSYLLNVSYSSYLENNGCKRNIYSPNDSKSESKMYADGYKCGVAQAVKVGMKFESESNVKANQPRTIETIEVEINELKKKVEGSSPEVSNVYQSMISALQQEQTNIRNSNNEKDRRLIQQEKDIENNANRDREQYQQIQSNLEYQKNLQQLKVSNTVNREKLVNSYTNSLNQLSSTMQNAMIQQVKNDLMQREVIMSNFYSLNDNKLNTVINFYNSIDKKAFKKNVNGLYKGFVISKKKYVYYSNTEITTIEECLLIVKDNKLINLYLNGNKEMELDYPLNFPNQSTFSNGVVRYNDINTYQIIDVLMLEPYIQNNSINNINENEVGNIVVYSSNKKDEGRTIHLQELNVEYNTLLREIEVKVYYAKNEKEIIEKTDVEKTAVNINRKINYLCDITKTPYGYIPLHAKTNNKVLVPLDKGETRYVKIGYRDND